jgi:ParB-like chromosome segregation protein Spo0J
VTEVPVELLTPVDTFDHLDEDKVTRYAAILADLPPVTVFSLPEGYLLVDGYHRVAAARLLGRTVVTADVRLGTRTDALRFAVQRAEEGGISTTDALDAIHRRGGRR